MYKDVNCGIVYYKKTENNPNVRQASQLYSKQTINYGISVPQTIIQPLKRMYLNGKISKKLLSEKNK